MIKNAGKLLFAVSIGSFVGCAQEAKTLNNYNELSVPSATSENLKSEGFSEKSQTLGGFFHYTRYDKDEMFDRNITQIKPWQESRCTAAFAFHKKDNKYTVRMTTHMECLKYYAYYGERAEAEVYLPNSRGNGYLQGNRAIPLHFKEDGLRNKYLAENSSAKTWPRKIFLDLTINIERAGGLRRAATPEQADILCLNKPASGKVNYDFPTTAGCLWFTQLEIRDFVIPADFATQNTRQLETLVQRTLILEHKMESDPLLSRGTLALLKKRDADIQKLSALEFANTRVSAADLIAEATCDAEDVFNIWCGENQTVYLQFLKKYFPPTDTELLDKAISSHFSKGDIDAIKTAWVNAKAATLKQRKIVIQDLLQLSEIMKNNRQALFLASNHLTATMSLSEKVGFSSMHLFNRNNASNLPGIGVEIVNSHLIMAPFAKKSTPGALFDDSAFVTLNGYPLLTFVNF